MNPLFVGIGLIVLIIGFVIMIYNGLVMKRQRVNQAFADVDVQLKQRQNLIPNLVETVKGYAKHERETLEAVIAARNQAEKIREKLAGAVGDAHTMAQLGQAEGMLGSVLGRLFALSEAYPDLKANENFQQLQEELTSTENRVAYARQAYNDAAMTFNNVAQTIPSNIVAGLAGFKSAGMVEFEDREAIVEAPKVSFG